MNHLVGVLHATDNLTIYDQLEQAYQVLAKTWLAHRSAPKEPSYDKANWREFAQCVRDAEGAIDLSQAHQECGDITDRPERPVEIFNALGHMEVLLASIELLPDELMPKSCAPTQQYTDNTDSIDGEAPQRIADLSGEGFDLEAYGGVNYRNNSKMALDFEALRRVKSEHPKKRCFVAVRSTAVQSRTTDRELPRWSTNDRQSATCASRHGGPFRIECTIANRWSHQENPYLLFELNDIRRET